jgi:hypothetical protein
LPLFKLSVVHIGKNGFIDSSQRYTLYVLATHVFVALFPTVERRSLASDNDAVAQKNGRKTITVIELLKSRKTTMERQLLSKGCYSSNLKAIIYMEQLTVLILNVKIVKYSSIWDMALK